MGTPSPPLPPVRGRSPRPTRGRQVTLEVDRPPREPGSENSFQGGPGS